MSDDTTKRLLILSPLLPTGGTVSCRRADVVVTIPTACMFEETLMHVEVDRGNVYMSNISTNFDTVTLYNTNGVLRADDVTGVRMNMNTSIGQVTPQGGGDVTWEVTRASA
eukprot:9159396-Pyramimonas_sp.AAC.1